MRDGPRVGIAKARLIPDARIVGSHCAQRNDPWRVIAQIPFHAVDADDEIFGLGVELSNQVALRVEDLKFERSRSAWS